MSADMSLFCFCVPTDNRPPFERLEPYWSMFVRALYVQKRKQLAGVSMLPPIKGHAWAAAYTVGRGGMGLDQRCPLSYKYQMYGTSSQKAPDQQMFVSLDHTTCDQNMDIPIFQQLLFPALSSLLLCLSLIGKVFRAPQQNWDSFLCESE